MLGRFIKNLVILIFGIIIGFVGAFAGVALGGVYLYQNVKVGQVTSPIFGENENLYVSDELKEMTFSQAIEKLTSKPNVGEIEDLVPAVSQLVDKFMDSEISAADGKTFKVSELVSLDREKFPRLCLPFCRS
ncbi:MAG: hypothetical protein MJ072_01330 [Clostridia bacterium]|nr:hypothetical protein [Clostridia bacterium]